MKELAYVVNYAMFLFLFFPLSTMFPMANDLRRGFYMYVTLLKLSNNADNNLKNDRRGAVEIIQAMQYEIFG